MRTTLTADRRDHVRGERLILVVEPDQQVRTAIEDVLEGDGHAVAVAATGKQALAWAAFHVPTLAILDESIPLSDRLSLLAALDTADRNVPIVLTGCVKGSRSTALSGAMAHLPKPFGRDALLTAIRDALASTSQPRARHG